MAFGTKALAISHLLEANTPKFPKSSHPKLSFPYFPLGVFSRKNTIPLASFVASEPGAQKKSVSPNPILGFARERRFVAAGAADVACPGVGETS